MTFLKTSERAFLSTVSRLAFCNPFLPELEKFQRQALGPEFKTGEPPLSRRRTEGPDRMSANSWKVYERLTPLIDVLRERLAAGKTGNESDLVLYEDAVLYLLYFRYLEAMSEATFANSGQSSKARWSFYREFSRDWGEYLKIPGTNLPTGHDAAQTFAIFIQFRRAFRYIFTHIIGGSPCVVRLRAAVWQSIFTCDLRRYRRSLYWRMGEFPTLITGPSGTGKELVAQALAKSRYVPFDEKKMAFDEQWEKVFYPINLPALSPTLIESELFGHRRGAFTGAVRDRRGWFEICQPGGTVFLDEIGDLDPLLQVKLLRVIETRTFQPVGDETDRKFRGKIVAATNRDLGSAIKEGGFREDLYYRLCSDRIVMPSLHDVLQESPEAISELVLFMAHRLLSEEDSVEGDLTPEMRDLAEEVEAWIEKELGPDYEWPGNYRELEQCVRNILIHREYRPMRFQVQGAYQGFFEQVKAGKLDADQLLRWYCTHVYSQTGNFAETARRLQLDRRTVKAKIDPKLLEELEKKS